MRMPPAWPTREVRALTESRVLVVLLAQAVTALRQGRGAPGVREAREWVCARDQAGGRLSFTRACESIGVEAREFRRRLGLRAQAPRRRTARGLVRRPGR